MIQNLESLFVHTLKDIHYAENKIARTLPKMIKAAQDDELREALSTHLDETREQIERLRQVFEVMGKKAATVKCEAIEGILKEGDSILDEVKGSGVADNAIAAAGQAVEHYEMMRYKTLLMWCEQLDLDDTVGELLQQNLDEEMQANEKLAGIGTRLDSVDIDEDGQKESAAPARKTTRKSPPRRTSQASRRAA